MLPFATSESIFVAVLAGVVSLLGLIISKENKVSDFRQAWIDSLREEISKMISHAIVAEAYRNHGKGRIPLEIWAEMRDDFVEMNIAMVKISLRLNDSEPEHAKLQALMKGLEGRLVANSNGGISQLCIDIENAGRTILKKEWEVVKRGEVTFRIAKWAAALSIILFALLIFSMRG